MEYSMEIMNVSKLYGTLKALDRVSFQVEKGILFAFLGPNGAGKSTMIDLISTLSDCDKGKLIINGWIAGRQDDLIRKSIGVVFQNSVLDDLLTVEENLMSRCGLYGMRHKEAKSRIRELSEMVSLQDILYQKTATLSGGQRRRVDIARALIARPQLLILDEPTTGLDPASRDQIWKTIAMLQKNFHMTVFLTTHYLEEAKNAQQICLLQKGRITAQGTPQQIRRRYASDHLFLYSEELPKLERILDIQRIAYASFFDHIEIEVHTSMQALSIIKRVERSIQGFEVIAGTLDDAFLNIMEGGGEDADTNTRETQYASVL